MNHLKEINEDEIRIINRGGGAKTPLWRQRRFRLICAAVLLILLIALLLLLRLRKATTADEPETAAEALSGYAESDALSPTMMQSAAATVLVQDTTVNDVPLRLQTPVNAVPSLHIGIPDSNDASLLLALQAADIRADNQQIVGAFVLDGELLSRGLSKKGFCAIIGGIIRIGMAESTPLLEEAIEKEGCFFRQYPLVSDGRMVENRPKGKAVRHALCELEGRITVVSSLSRESFHDFAQALADLGVRQAISLCGGESFGFRHLQGQPATPWGGDPQIARPRKYNNFIVWKRME
ncbi:MAG: hypothetical protein J6X35_11670 [Bacteroidales bacterium]|nr:hypothetical protein [Bacteroidales bacterium]